MISKLLKKNEKGFTLMEMLIVVAIIAVLIAIAIPTFNSSLNRAKVATDEANIRSGYASVMLTIIDKDPGADETYTLLTTGDVKAASDQNATGTEYKTVGVPSEKVNIAGIEVSAWAKDQTVTYKYTHADGKIAIQVGTTSNP